MLEPKSREEGGDGATGTGTSKTAAKSTKKPARKK
jgi:hypothetical protein